MVNTAAHNYRQCFDKITQIDILHPVLRLKREKKHRSYFLLFEYEIDDGYGIDEERGRVKIDWNKKAKRKAGPIEIGTTNGYKGAKVS